MLKCPVSILPHEHRKILNRAGGIVIYEAHLINNRRAAN